MAVLAMFALGLGTVVQPPAPATIAGAVVTCRVEDDRRARVYALIRPPGAGVAWSLAFQQGGAPSRWVILPLPGAAPDVTRDRVRLQYRSGNGGRLVALDLTARGGSIDVFADHGLEVNVDTALDPRIDEMTTDGPLTRVQCRLTNTEPPKP